MIKQRRMYLYFFVIAGLLSINCQFAYSLLPSRDVQKRECSEFELTPEECANLGKNTYSSSEKILFDKNGETCFPSDDDVTLTIHFINKDAFVLITPVGYEIEFNRVERNYFEGQFTQPDGKYRWEDSITFTENGLIIEASSYLVEGDEHLCTFFVEHEIILSSEQ